MRRGPYPSKPPRKQLIYEMTAAHFTARLSVREGRVVEADPIVKHLIGKTHSAMQSFARKHGYKLVLVNRLRK